ncbi:MAG: class II aldolase/adducin family protein [Burkholderiales bacterium]|nr:class II aldolase/adducin family protein [Burkholderiales bacterium]
MNAPDRIRLNADGMAPEVARLQTNMPSPPRFTSLSEERLHRKQRLAAAFRIFGQWGLGEGAAGHITVRDPEHPETFWLNPFGVHFSRVKVSNLIRVDHAGNVVEGDHPVNRAAFAIHSRIHQARPDVVAAAHTHGVYGRAFSALGRPLAMISQDACAFYDDHVVYDDYGGVVLELDEGARIASALGSCKAAILRNHGLLTVGGSVDEAAWWYLSMERNCQVQLMAEAAAHGQPLRLVPEASCRQAYGVVGTPFAGWFSFNLLYDRLVAEAPGFLD